MELDFDCNRFALFFYRRSSSRDSITMHQDGLRELYGAQTVQLSDFHSFASPTFNL